MSVSAMNVMQIPYTSSINKCAFDYFTQVSAQLNNVNLSRNLDAMNASFDNLMFLIIDYNFNVYLYLGLSNMDTETKELKSYCDIIYELQNPEIIQVVNCNYRNNSNEFKSTVYSLDIKKYNSVVAFTEDYQSRNKIRMYFDDKKLYYYISENNYVELSPFVVTDETEDKILKVLYKYVNQVVKDKYYMDNHLVLRVDSVDRNSFLLPYMAYKDFLNFAVYSDRSRSFILTDAEDDGHDYFVNTLYDENGKLVFYSETDLRNDKFEFYSDGAKCKSNVEVSNGLWQLLTILQHFKNWIELKYSYDSTARLDIGKGGYIYHFLAGKVNYNFNTENSFISYDDLVKYELVSRQHSNDLYKINKLFSNASRSCYFNFADQTFTGNNYVFNSDKLELKTIDLDNPIETKLPLKITLTEIKHYIGSDLSQKNFNLYIYTDGINVMLERWDNDNKELTNRVIFNHTMSRKNQNLPIN